MWSSAPVGRPARSASVSSRCSIADDAADRVQREAERQIDRRQELDRHDDDEREARLEREQADRLDLDRPEPQLQRAAVAAAAHAEEPAAAHEPGVEQRGRCRSASLSETDSGLVPAIASAGSMRTCSPAPSTVAVIAPPRLHVIAAGDVDRVGEALRQLERDLAHVERTDLRPRRQHDARAGAAAERQPARGIDAERDVGLHRSPAPPSRLAIAPPPTPTSMPVIASATEIGGVAPSMRSARLQLDGVERQRRRRNQHAARRGERVTRATTLRP